MTEGNEKETEETEVKPPLSESSESPPNKLKCEKCLLEWERDRPETFENCPYRKSAECPISRIIALRSFS